VSTKNLTHIHLLALRMILVLFADLDPRTLFKLAVARIDTLLDHVPVELSRFAKLPSSSFHFLPKLT